MSAPRKPLEFKNNACDSITGKSLRGRKGRCANHNWHNALCLLLMIFLGLAGPLVSEAVAATQTVTNTNDSGPGSLREAIETAEPGDVIVFAANARGTIVLDESNGGLIIDKALTITGPGANRLTISGDFSVAVFFVTASPVKISGLRIIQGNLFDDDGAGLLNTGDLTLTDCVFSGNEVSDGVGGAIANEGTLAITNCIIADNEGDGGGGVANSGTLTITDSQLIRNASDEGGGLLNRGQATITRSTLWNNSADSGGGIFNGLSAGLVLINSTVSGNRAPETEFAFDEGEGGGITNLGRLSINSSTIFGNRAGNEGSSAARGGGVLTSSGAVTIANSIIAGNSANDAPDVAGTFTSSGYNLIGIASGGSGFSRAKQDQFGTTASPLDARLGPLANYGGPTPTHALLSGSPALDKGKSFGFRTDQRGRKRPVDLPAIPNAPGGDGSDIGAFERATVTAPPTTLIVNTTNDNDDGSCTLAHCSLREAINDANTLPDANTILFRPDVRGTITLRQGQFDLISDVTIMGPGAGDLTVSGDNANRIFNIQGVSVEIVGLTIANGFVFDEDGGGIFNTGDLTLRECVLRDNSIEVNFDGGLGGGLYHTDGTLKIINSAITGNEAVFGGGFFSTMGDVYVIRSTISNNNASRGGGILHDLQKLIIGNSTISANEARIGGGVFATGNATIHNSTFSGNLAFEGGGLFMQGGVELIGNTITRNSGFGGGVDAFGTIRCGNNIIAGNGTPGVGSPDITGGGFTSRGFNLIGVATGDEGFDQPSDQSGTANAPLSPQLGPLADNGGPAPTHAVLPGSPALDKGNSFDLRTDQRGVSRPIDLPAVPNVPGGDGSDIGAFERDLSQGGATLTVNTTDDGDDGLCGSGHCSLREAIQAANARPGKNTIRFNIPRANADFSRGMFVIRLNNPLPALIAPNGDGTLIDGTTQTTFGGDTNIQGPEVMLNGQSAGADANGLEIRAANCSVRGLVITGFAGSGIAIRSGSATGNTLRANHIFDNGRLGIDLRLANEVAHTPTANDVGDRDTGANNGQNYPVLTSAIGGGRITSLQGTLNSTPNTSFVIDFYANEQCDASGFGEGERFLGSATVSTNGSGSAVIDVRLEAYVALGQVITATATDPNGNTSEFSACVQVKSTTQ
jgi:CSLREA domain-containing protein